MQALLRPGRFDRLVYVGVAGGAEERRRVLTSLTRKFAFKEGFGVAGIGFSMTLNDNTGCRSTSIYCWNGEF